VLVHIAGDDPVGVLGKTAALLERDNEVSTSVAWLRMCSWGWGNYIVDEGEERTSGTAGVVVLPVMGNAEAPDVLSPGGLLASEVEAPEKEVPALPNNGPDLVVEGEGLAELAQVFLDGGAVRMRAVLVSEDDL